MRWRILTDAGWILAASKTNALERLRLRVRLRLRLPGLDFLLENFCGIYNNIGLLL